MTECRVHFWVSGRVQGVFFRVYTEKTAKQLELKGLVRNLPDRRVEVIAEGPKEKLEEFIKWAKEKGSPYSSVTKVEVEWEEFRDEFVDFRTTY